MILYYITTLTLTLNSEHIVANGHPLTKSRQQSPSPVNRRLVDDGSRGSRSPIRSPIRSSSVNSRNSREDVPEISSDVLDQQYELAKNYYKHNAIQHNLATKLANNNLQMMQMQTNSAITRATSTERPSNNNGKNNVNSYQSNSQGTTYSNSTNTGNLSRSSSPSVSISSVASGNLPYDWVECFDHKTNRKYYHSASR